MREVRRNNQRVASTVPVKVAGHAAGLTRDVSPSGIFFNSDLEMTSGSTIQFSLEFDEPTGKLTLECTGQVVRVERENGKLGVAVKITTSRLERTSAPSRVKASARS